MNFLTPLVKKKQKIQEKTSLYYQRIKELGGIVLWKWSQRTDKCISKGKFKKELFLLTVAYSGLEQLKEIKKEY